MTHKYRELKLGTVCSFKTGKLDSNAAVDNGEYPFFTCSQETYRTNTYSFDTEAVLLGGNNANGIYPIKYFRGKFDAYQRTYIIRTLDDKILSNRFLYYSLGLKLDLLRRISTGATTKFLTLNILNGLDLSFPTITVQKQIVAIVSAYDDLINNNTRRIKILEEMTQTIYNEWFVKFRFPGHSKVKMVKSELGEIPEGWVVTTLESVCNKIIAGGTPSRRDESYWKPGTVKWFKTKELQGGFLIDSEEYISESGLSDSAAKLMPSETILLAIYAAPTVGRLGILATEASYNQAICGLIPNPEYLTVSFLFYKLYELREYFNNIAQGAAQQNISTEKVRNAKIALPIRTLVDEFGKLVDPIMEGVKNISIRNRLLRQSRDILLPRLISGELDVEDLDIKVEN